ncbi:MAG TPA: sigma-70 family RNA polymerase sigma factor [Acidimicrobiia bacterium]|nr:sigma-70 family RNA polymerase sigma factor [Acidimicrobiia bacterium]
MPLGPDFDSVLGAAKAGADWAWALLYRDLAGPITGYLASRRAPSPEDVAAETFLQVARGIHGFEGDEAAFRSWVFVIAHRRLIDARRKVMREPNLVALPIDESGYQGGNVETEAMDRLVTAELEQALGALTDDQHDVLALRVIANLTLEETADAVGKRVGAVKALQRRGLTALRTHLDQGRVSP